MKKMSCRNWWCLAGLAVFVWTLPLVAIAADRVVVVPLGGAVGDAVAADVVKGKTFSSKVGKGVTGTLEQHPMGQTYTNANNMTFNLVPAGTFIMGSPDGTGGAEPAEPGRYTNEVQHKVTLTKSLYMQTTEVTQKQWQDVIGNNPAASVHGDNYPVETVNWFEAAYFANTLSTAEGLSACYTLTGCSPAPGNNMQCTGVAVNTTCTGYRLPTEAEWEHAARAGTTTAYANPVSFDTTNTEIATGFNSNLAAMGWYFWNRTNSGYADGSKPVGQKQANQWGLYDMHGNVYEWCQDWWDGGAYSSDPVTDPQGDASGTARVFRGGAWYSNARFTRSAYRFNGAPGYRNMDLGFRLALSPGQ